MVQRLQADEILPLLPGRGWVHGYRTYGGISATNEIKRTYDERLSHGGCKRSLANDEIGRQKQSFII